MRATVERFLNYLAYEQEASPHTIAAYRNDLEQFLDLLSAHHLSSWEDVGREHVVAFLHWLEEKDYAVSTIARKVAAVRSFFHFLVERGELEDDPSIAVPPPRVPRQAPQVLSPQEISTLLSVPRGSGTPKALRDTALLELLYATGMRASEIIGLEIEDLDLAEQTVVCGAGDDDPRTLPLTARVIEALQVYLQRGRPRLARGEGQGILFLNHRGCPLTRQGLWLIVKERAAAAGLEAVVTPHTLRHSYAAHQLARGVSVEDVQGSLGHANLATTQVYIEHVDQGENDDDGA